MVVQPLDDVPTQCLLSRHEAVIVRIQFAFDEHRHTLAVLFQLSNVATRSRTAVDFHAGRGQLNVDIVRVRERELAARKVTRVVPIAVCVLLLRDDVVPEHRQRHVEVAHESRAVARQLESRADELHSAFAVTLDELRRGLDAEPVHGEVRVVVAARQNAEHAEHFLSPSLHHGHVELDVRTLAIASLLVQPLCLLFLPLSRLAKFF